MTMSSESGEFLRSTAYYHALVETVIHGSVLSDHATSSAIVGEVANSLQQQIRLVPQPIRLAVRVALISFSCEAILYHRKTFRSLSLEDRKKHLLRWESSRIRGKRDIVRFVRSMSLFNFYDHPDVRAKI